MGAGSIPDLVLCERDWRSGVLFPLPMVAGNPITFAERCASLPKSITCAVQNARLCLELTGRILTLT